ncbi:MAG: nitrous oxide-stimulated promoter family protein [Bacillota bacterium]|nr:nitrous oxide-stimulated promoter family protein [Bacillota bacterium]
MKRTRTQQNKQRADEREIVEQMIALYCRSRHRCSAKQVVLGADGKTLELCKDCAELLDYARMRVDRCPRMETKSFCSACRTHCYRPSERERIKHVMRFSGPRMLLRRPILVLKHLAEERKQKRRQP